MGTVVGAMAGRSVAAVVALASVVFLCVTGLLVVTVITDADLTPVAVLAGLAAPTITSLMSVLRAEDVRTEVRGLVAGPRQPGEF